MQTAKRKIDKTAIAGIKTKTLLKRVLATWSKQGSKGEEMGKGRKTIPFAALKQQKNVQTKL